MKITRVRVRPKRGPRRRVCSPAGIPLLERQIAHWAQEVAESRAQVAAGQHPEHDAACRRYIAECRGTLRSLRQEIKSWSAERSDRRGAGEH